MSAYTYHILVTYKNDAGETCATLTRIRTTEPIEVTAKRLDISIHEMAARVVRNKNSRISTSTNILENVTAEQIKNISRILENSRDAMSIRLHNETFGFDYYIYPEGQSRIAIHRNDNNTGESYTDYFIVPTNIVNMSCDGSAIKRLFAQIVEEYTEDLDEAHSGAFFTWHDLIAQIPNEFLKIYGVERIDIPELMFEIQVNANETVIPEK